MKGSITFNHMVLKTLYRGSIGRSVFGDVITRVAGLKNATTTSATNL